MTDDTPPHALRWCPHCEARLAVLTVVVRQDGLVRGQIVCTSCRLSGPEAASGVCGLFGQTLLQGVYDEAIKGWEDLWSGRAKNPVGFRVGGVSGG